MAQESYLVDEWIDAHQSQYEQLFDDGRVQESEINLPQGQSETIALSALARYTGMESRPRTIEYTTMAEVTQGVSTMLDACNQGLFGAKNSVLNSVRSVPHGAIKLATARVITHWERACLRRNMSSPFEDMIIADVQPEDIELTATRLILMTAAALVVVLKKYHSKPSANVPKWAMSGIKYYGPGFTDDFIEGNNPNNFLSNQAFNACTVLTASRRKEVLATSPKTPELTLEKIATNLDVPSSEKLAKILGWSIQRTADIFTPSVIRELAYTRRNIPFITTAQRVRHLYDNVLTPEAIGRSLGITPEHAEFMFTGSYIHNLVFSSPDADPIDRLRDTLTLTRKLTNNFRLSYPLAVWMAAYLPGQALDRAALVEQEQSNRPRGVSEDLWAATVAKYPKQGDLRRDRVINNVIAYWNFLNAISLDAKPIDNRALEERVPDSTYSPEHILFDDESTSSLKDMTDKLLTRANLSESDKQELLEFFRDADTEPTPPIVRLMERVRAASRQPK